MSDATVGLGSTSSHVLAQPTSGTQEKQQAEQQGPRVKLYVDLMSQPSRACVIFSRCVRARIGGWEAGCLFPRVREGYYMSSRSWVGST